jgi:hypothetical protein
MKKISTLLLALLFFAATAFAGDLIVNKAHQIVYNGVVIGTMVTKGNSGFQPNFSIVDLNGKELAYIAFYDADEGKSDYWIVSFGETTTKLARLTCSIPIRGWIIGQLGQFDVFDANGINPQGVEKITRILAYNPSATPYIQTQ